MSLGLTEILVIFVAILLLFGAKRIPEIARALGRASHEFKKAKDEIINETEELKDAAEKKAALEDQAGKKDNDKALEYLDKVVTIFPEDEDAHEMIRKLS